MKNIFEIKNVNFSVDGIEKVKNVSFSIENEGDIICLLGPSGIGKTTILRTIAGLEKINEGEIFLKGQLISCLLYTSPSPRDRQKSRMPSSA